MITHLLCYVVGVFLGMLTLAVFMAASRREERGPVVPVDLEHPVCNPARPAKGRMLRMNRAFLHSPTPMVLRKERRRVLFFARMNQGFYEVQHQKFHDRNDGKKQR